MNKQIGSQFTKIAAALIAFFILFSFAGCKTASKAAQDPNVPPQLPRITSHSVKIGKISKTGVEVFVYLTIENPNRFPLPPPKIDYNLIINRNPFIRGTVSDKPLAASGSTQIEVKLQVSFTDLFRNIASLIASREAASIFQFACDFGMPALSGIISRELPFMLPLR